MNMLLLTATADCYCCVTVRSEMRGHLFLWRSKEAISHPRRHKQALAYPETRSR